MFLTKINPKHGIDDYQIHQYVKSIFPGEQKVLWQQNNAYLYVLSENKSINNNERYEEIDLEEICKEGNQHLFTLRINNSYKDKLSGKRKKVPFHKIKQWIERKFETAGFESKFQFQTEGYRESYKNNIKNIRSSVLIKGFLTVKDSSKFKESLINGIGFSKYLGFGFINIFE